jgi:hypothetical protein
MSNWSRKSELVIKTNPLSENSAYTVWQGQKNNFVRVTSPTLKILLASPFLEVIPISAMLNLG